MDINYEYYKVFYYVAKNENLTKAAKALNSNQPNVSRVMRLLENELGVSLMIRESRGIRLTPEGQMLFTRVKAAVEQLSKAEEEMHNLTVHKSGIVTIGVSETALYTTVLPVLGNFRKKYPEIEIRLRNHLTHDALASIIDGHTDFSVVVLSDHPVSPLVSTDIDTFEDILIASPTIIDDVSRRITLRELADYPIISMDAGTSTYSFYRNFFAKHHLEFKPMLTAVTTDQVLPMVKAGLGIAFVPEIYAKEALVTGNVIKINLQEDIPLRRITLVENREYPLSIAANCFKEYLLKGDSFASKK